MNEEADANNFLGVESVKRLRCSCGKVCFDKKSAATIRNNLHRRGNARRLRIYQCPESNTWHLTNDDFKSRNDFFRTHYGNREKNE